jgi:hypothetical protein
MKLVVDASGFVFSPVTFDYGARDANADKNHCGKENAKRNELHRTTAVAREHGFGTATWFLQKTNTLIDIVSTEWVGDSGVGSACHTPIVPPLGLDCHRSTTVIGHHG